MATSKGTAIAAPQIFNSDPVEQIYARGVIGDPNQSGIAGAMLNAAQDDRAKVQSTYLGALGESNRMAAQLAQREMEQDTLKELIKSAAEQANAGINPQDIPMYQKLYQQNYGNSSVAEPSRLSRDLKAADALSKRAQAAKAASEGGPQTTITRDFTTTGQGEGRITTKGHNLESSMRESERAAAREREVRGYPKNPDGTIRLPTTAEARAATDRLNARDRGQ